MPKVIFTPALKKFFPGMKLQVISANTVSEAILELDTIYPGLKNYLLEDNGSLRRHVNIYIGNNLINDREKLSDSIREKDEIYILQAMSGG